MLETRDDFDDDVTGIDETSLRNGNASLSQSRKLSSLLVAMQNKPKVWISSPLPLEFSFLKLLINLSK